MTSDELAASIKAKYPQYKDMDNSELVQRTVSKYPQYQEHLDTAPQPQQPGMGSAALDAVKQALPNPSIQGQGLSPSSSNPILGGLQAVGQLMQNPLQRMQGTVSAPGQMAGDAAEQKLDKAGHPIVGKVANVAVSAALDPTSYVGVGEAGQKLASKSITSISNKVEEGLAKLSKWKLGASVPETAANIAKDKHFDLPTPSQQDIEAGVQNVQKVLNDVKSDAGKLLNDAKSKIGIPTSVEEKEASLGKYGNVHGLGKEEVNSDVQALLDTKDPSELAAGIAKFKSLSAGGTSDPKLQARVASALQDKINGIVDWQKTGTQTEGVLKQQYKDLGNMVTDHAIGLSDAKKSMAKAFGVFDDLENKLADKDKEGKAEQFLRNLFTKPTGANKDYLEKLARLEEISGKPVLTKLFEQFAGESFNKLAGSPKLASAAATEGVMSAFHGNLPGVLGSATYLATQSPSVIKAIGKANAAAAKAGQAAVKHKLGKVGLAASIAATRNGFSLMSQNNNGSELQSLRDRLSKKD